MSAKPTLSQNMAAVVWIVIVFAWGAEMALTPRTAVDPPQWAHLIINGVCALFISSRIWKGRA